MAWRPKPPVERVRDGYRVHLEREERDLLERLLGELRDLLVGPADHPGLARIFPVAYHLPEHAGHDEEYQRLMREDLVASRLSGIEQVLAVVSAPDGATIDEAAVTAFMQALNGLRLVLGTVLDVQEDHDPDDVPDDHPMVGEYHLYGYLSWLLEWTVRALSGARS
jgi:hypothetical protein